MAAANAAPDETATEPVVHLLWINAGLSCDGDSVALTSATQPSIEEIALGALPGLPKIAVHWPLIDFDNGPVGGANDFIEWFFKADRGELEPFVLVVEGSIPNEAINGDGYWTGFGNNPETGQPMTINDWLDRLAPKALALVAAGTCATYGGIHAMAGNPTGAMGVADYLGWTGGRRPASRSSASRAARSQPRQLRPRRCCTALPGGGRGADDPARRRAAPDLAVRRDGPRGLRPRRATTSRATSRPSTARPSASSSSAAGARW